MKKIEVRFLIYRRINVEGITVIDNHFAIITAVYNRQELSMDAEYVYTLD